ncbi:exodeoxyribonuclease [Weissella oryzae SG25]|uniref:Exodeoxyribonuclease n=1 Tax=Weissella oryzae (strain DSM 25784 / JCM 18191 / LMG 30913 / SG25) TaxID=1329250 RepID=A0A069CXD8_WEIOS|nr:ATP-dependent RecD-like DNA helicase [Weissella oryzae]GAK31878.1 exodeoxyribonuclease [Weissella oryzae SG25]
MEFTEYNPRAAKNYQFHLEVVNGISQKRAEVIAGTKSLFLALVNGYDGKDNDKQVIYNDKSIELLTQVPNITEETAKRYIEEYNNNPFQDVNWEVKKQLDRLALENPEFGLNQNKIYKIAKAVDDLENPWSAYKTGALTFEFTANIYGMFTKDNFEKRKKVLAVWNAEYQLREKESQNLITVKKSDYILDDDSLKDYGIVTPFMDGWARTETLRAYKIVNDLLKNNVGVSVGHEIEDVDLSDLFDDQKEAVEKIMKQPISFLTGYAGTGKTFVIKKVLEALGYKGKSLSNYAVATALAGKAVKNFVESVDGINIQTTTITGVRKVDKYRKLFAHATTIVVDEFSMISLQDLAYLFKINPEARYIFIGDSNQLPAIGLDVLQRLEDENLLVPIKLTIPKRQAADSGIFKDSMDVIKGEMPKFEHPDSTAYFNTPGHEWMIEEIVSRHPNADVFLTTANGAKDLINAIKHQEIIQRTPEENLLNFDGKQFFAHGDKIIVGKNNPDTGFMNGDIFIIVRDEDTGKFYLNNMKGERVLLDDVGQPLEFNDINFDFQKHKAELGFAITVHKSQGSTINNVVSILGYSRLSSRNILYTALTRAKESHALYMPSKKILQGYLDTKVSYQSIDIDQLNLDLLEENEAIERMNGYTR